MLKPVSVAVLFAAPVVALSACSPPGEVPSDSPGTTPSVWTGSPSPSAAPGESGSGHGAAAAAGETLSAEIKTADGTSVATADIQFADGFATVTVETTSPGVLTPGFHGLHIHSVGVCEANSVAPNGGAPGNFNSAGGHFQVAGHSGHPSSGDLSSLQIRADGSGKLVTTTDAFTAEDLQAGAKTSIIIHEKADNFANIPPEKYQQVVGGAPGPDQATLSTGDAGSRVACGVIGAG